MDSSYALSGSPTISPTTNPPANSIPSRKGVTCEFAIALIMLIGGLTAIGVGAGGYFQVGGFAFNQVRALSLLALGSLFTLLGCICISDAYNRNRQTTLIAKEESKPGT